MSSSSSADEKGEDWHRQDPAVAAVEPKEYAPIVTEPLDAVGTEKELGANGDKANNNGVLSRLNSATTEASDDLSDAKSSAKRKKKWYQKMDPFKWGADPPVPETRLVSREYQAGLFSRLTFQWMHPLMTVSDTRITYSRLPLIADSS